MELKHYKKQCCVAVWSSSKSYGQLLACASANPNNPALSDLQILSVDLADPSKNLKQQGKSLYNTPYRCLAWGTFGQKQGTYPYGLIFGGMQNGSFTLWNPAEIIGQFDDVSQSNIEEQSSILFAQQAQDQGCPILCAEWNSLKNNYLAFASTSLLILDVSRDISSPAILKPTSPHQGTYITSVSWNKQVPHILASAGNDGLIALYDLKTSKSIFSFRDNSTITTSRNVQIAWSKHISPQIAVTFDDQKKNQLQIWDLRNQKGPIVVIDKVHSKGINTMDWSELDHDLILTASRDNQIVCWNYKQDEQPLISRRVDSQVVKVAWSKALPSIYSVVSLDGVSICSLDDSNIHSYIPKWLKVPASSTLNGSQNVVSFLQERGNNIQQYLIKPQIKKQLSHQIAILQQLLQNQNIQAFKQAEGDQFWKLISIKKNQQQNDTDIFQFLGLNKEKITKQLQKYTGKKRDSFSINNTKSSENKKKSKPSKAVYVPISMTQADSIFGSLGQGTQNLEKSFNKNNDDQFQNQNVKYETVQKNFNWDIGKQRLIKQNMLIGNYQGAIDAALKCGRTAEALIIAYSMDQTTFNSTLKTFFTQTTDNFISGILRYIAFKDTEQLVKKYDLKKWKQCIALILSLSSSDKRRNLLSQLAKRLHTQQPGVQQFQQASVYSYILAQQFQQIVQIYLRKLKKHNCSSLARKIQLVNLATRLIAIFNTSTVTIKKSQNFQRIIKQLAFVCLQVNKKLLSYTLFTKFISQPSSKYIDYLIQNTQQLSTYRGQSTPIITLPVMNKRQQKSKKPQKNEEVPVNIKPSKQSKVQIKNTFQQPQNDIKVSKTKQSLVPPPPPSRTQQRTEAVSSPPPPPPPPSHQHTAIHPAQVKQKGVPLPPPNKRVQNIQQQESQQQEQQQQSTHHAPPPPPTKKVNVPPPPPPSKAFSKQSNNSFQQPSSKKTNLPPPPPQPNYNKNNERQQPITPTDKGFTSNNNRAPPPPPQMHNTKKLSQQQYHEKHEPVIKKNTLPPPPKNNIFVPPPSKSNQPPPPTRQPQKKQPQPQQDEQQEQQWPQPRSQKGIPPPPSKNVAPPPPTSVKKIGQMPPPPVNKQPTRTQPVQSVYQNQEPQQLSSSQQIQRRAPPVPTPGRKGPPPPPPRR